jgi:hypothetical protein
LRRIGTGELAPRDEHSGAAPFVNSLFARLPLAPDYCLPDPDDSAVQFGSENVFGGQSIKLPLPTVAPMAGNMWGGAHNTAMSTKSRKRNAGSPKTPNSSLRKDVQEALDRLWPDRLVEMSFDPNESYFGVVHPKLQRAFLRIPHAQLLQEREPEGGPIWRDGSDPEEDPPDDQLRSRSYHLFFVGPEGEPFTFDTEAESIAEPEFMTEEFEEAGWGEGPAVGRISGSGRTGWVVAVSLLAPLAVIELGDVITYDDGSTTDPEIETYGATEDGKQIDPEEVFRTTHDAEAYQGPLKLRAQISGIMVKHGITVLPAEEWRKAAPWLRGGEDRSPALKAERSACWTPSSLRNCSGKRAHFSPATTTWYE